jgi:hypothetical protein
LRPPPVTSTVEAFGVTHSSKPTGEVRLIVKGSALSTFDLASARLGAVRRRGGGGPAGGRSLPGARNGRRLGLNRRPFGGCRSRPNHKHSVRQKF